MGGAVDTARRRFIGGGSGPRPSRAPKPVRRVTTSVYICPRARCKTRPAKTRTKLNSSRKTRLQIAVALHADCCALRGGSELRDV